MPTVSFGQISIPREGFPYCEPFTGTAFDLRPETVLGGTPTSASVGGGVLQLTSNATYQSGFTYIDIPFSTEYGVKVSFEYFSYGGTVVGGGADGFSFFMFDAEYGDVLNGSSFPFHTGGFGGSLGYAPIRQNPSAANPTPPFTPGLSGGYIGIGFDEWGNFVRGHEQRVTGLPPNPLYLPYETYPNTVSIRGPEDPNNVGAVEGCVSCYQYLGPTYVVNVNSDFGFDIDSSTREFDCNDSDYRKVFIDLEPVFDGFGNPTGNYLISAHIRVGANTFTIFNKLPYNFSAPENIKIGFAASTGQNNNFHEIRNLAVDVSTIDDSKRPQVSDESYQTCIDEELEILFDVDLNSGDKSFIQCIQLFDPSDPTEPWNTSNVVVDHLSCGLTPICNTCNNGELVFAAEHGTFKVVYEDLTDVDFDQLRDDVKILFTPNPGETGESSVFYTVTDNFGLTSQVGEVKVIINPIPEFVGTAQITDPSCDGQGDGQIVVNVTNLLDGATHRWLVDGVPTAIAPIPNIVSGEAEITLTGVNIGNYQLEIFNPLNDGLGGTCANQLPVIPITQQNGTPVVLEPFANEVCEGNDAVITPSLDPIYNPNGLPVPFRWYASADRAGGVLSGAEVIDGVNVNVAVAADGTITISGLTSDGVNPKDYTIYVETDFKNNNGNGGNFCPYQGDVITEAVITVYPALQITPSITDDWCREGAGAIQVSAIGGSGDKTFTLLDIDDNVVDTQVDPTMAGFTGLLPGDYLVEIESNNPTCLASLPFTVEGPDDELFILEVDKTPASCEEDNGTFTVEIGDGNGTLSASSLSVNGGPSAGVSYDAATDTYTFTGLAPNIPYTALVTDSQNCVKSLPFTIEEIQKPVYSINAPNALCEDESEVRFSVNYDFFEIQATAVPEFYWYTTETGGTPISNGSGPFGMTYSANQASGELIVTNLVGGQYTLWLEMAGSDACNLPRQRVDFAINELPDPGVPVITNISCFSESDGEIQVVLNTGNLSDYLYQLVSNSVVVVAYQDNAGHFENLPAGDYVVSIQDKATGCEIDLPELSLVEPQALLFDVVDSVDPTCEQDNGSLVFAVSGGTPFSGGTYQVLINGQALSNFDFTTSTLLGGEFQVTVSTLAAGTYTVVAEDERGCAIGGDIAITAQILPEYALTDLTICLNESASVIPTVVNSGTPSADPVFHWYKDNAATQEITSGIDVSLKATFSVDSSTGELTMSAITDPGDYTFYLKPEIVNGCTLSAIPVKITVNPIPVADFTVIDASCFGGNDGQINLGSATGSYTYTLSTGESNSSGNFSGLSAGIYTVEVEDAISCRNTFDVEVGQAAVLDIVDVEFTDPTCGAINGEIVFDIEGGTPDFTILINGTTLSEFTSQVNNNRYTVQDLAPGNYSISVTDQNSCTNSEMDLFSLTNNDGLDLAPGPMDDTICEGTSATLTPNLTIPPGATPVLRWYKDASASVEIVSSSTPDADGIVYEISSTGVLTISNLTEGSYQYFLKISGPNICTITTQASVEVKGPISANPVATPITCFGDADGVITVENSTGGTGVYEYSLNSGTWQSENTFADLVAGSYTVTIRDASSISGCSTTYSVEVEGPDEAIQINTPDLIRASCDLSNGAIRNLEVSGGYGSYSFEWRKDDPLTGQLLSQGTLSGIEDLAPGTYFLLVSDSGGCEAQFSFTIGESSDPEYQVVPPIDSCFGTPITIRPIHIAPDPALPPAAATEVRWYKEPGQVGLISSGPDPQDPNVIYQIDDTDWLNPELVIENLPVGDHDFYFYVVCTGQEIEIDVTVFDTPAMVFDTSPVQCFGGTDGKISAVSGEDPDYRYSLNGGAPMTLPELEALGLTSGTYSVEIATPAGCPQVVSLEIEGPTAALEFSNYNQIDPGCGAANGKINVTVTGGWVPYTVQVYKNGTALKSEVFSQNNIVINDLEAGTYYLEITDSEGCTIATPALTLVDGPTQILVPDQSVCEGDVVTLKPVLDPAVPVASFTWSFDPSGSNLITSSPTPDANGVIYQIDAAGTLTVSGLASKAVPYKYYVTATGAGVCLGYLADPEVSVSDAPGGTAVVTDEQCFGDGGRIVINPSGGDGTYQYSLNNGPYQSSNTFDVAVGTYDISIRSGAGCEYVLDDIEVVGPSAPISVSNVKGLNASCNLDNGEITFTIAGGYGGYEVESYRDGASMGISYPDASGEFKISGLGIGTYSFQVKDSAGCVYEFESPLELVEEPTRIEVNDQQLCEGDTGVLDPVVTSSSPNVSFSWFFDAAGNTPITSGTTAGVTYTINSNGQLTVEGLTGRSTPYVYYVLAVGTGICGLEPTPATIQVSQIPPLRVSNPSVVCDPTNTVDLTQYIEGFNPNVYDYNVLSPSGASMQLSELSAVSTSGDYRVSSSLKGTSCWNAPQRIKVIIADELLQADFEYEVDFGGGNVVVSGEIQILEDVFFKDLSLGKAISWMWDFGDGGTATDQNPVHQYSSKGQYTVTLTTTDEFGCQSQYQLVVNAFDDYVIIVPNAFTPDGQKNIYFKPAFRGVASMDFYIFNTWGELIFESHTLETLGWDGTLKGTSVPNGNYVYRAKFKTRSGESVEKSGVFILIR